MNEDQLSRLRGRLQRKKQRLEATNGPFFLPKLGRFWQFLNSEPFLTPILSALASHQKGKTAAEAVATRGSPNSQFDPRVRAEIDSLATDEEVAAMAYHLFQGVCEKGWKFNEINMYVWGSHPGNLSEYNTFKPEVVAPFCEYLDEKLDERQTILGLLVRYKNRCEWFNRQSLRKIAADEQAMAGDVKERAEVEKVLKEDLYRYLHDQGLEFIIEPKSDKGEIDLIADQVVGCRKYLEGKVFDNKNRNKGYIIKGFGQLLHYLRQYNATDGYLLVYKTCEQQLVFDGAEHVGTVPFLRCEGKTLFLLVVDICEYTKAVSQRAYKPICITADEMTKAES
jgi:hypothetical protein